MASPILIAPDNRLLGWALSDLTLYGGQPTAGVTIGRAADADTGPIAASASTDSPPAAPTEGDAAADDTSALLADTVPAADPAPATAAPTVAPLPEPAAQEHLAPAQPIGSGSFTQPPVATPLQTVQAHDAPGDTGVAHGVATDPGADLAGAVSGVAAPLADAAGLTAPLTAAIDTLASGSVLDGLNHDALATVGDLAQPVVDVLPLSDFAGTDPAAGVMTLVGMVDSADAFDLGQAITPVADAAPTSILDALVADDQPAALLGDDHGGDHILDDDGGIHVGL